MPKLFWEDFRPGPVAECGPYLVTAEEIKAFAAEFDPQSMHVEDKAATDMVDGLFASGWHNCAIMMRLISDGFLCNSAFMGGAGCDEVKWLAPVRPDDRLVVRPQVIETRESRTRPEAGFVKFLLRGRQRSRDLRDERRRASPVRPAPAGQARRLTRLEHDPEKWAPVFG